MKHRKLREWIDGDDACEATAVTLYSAHDPSHDGERDFIIRRVKSLIKTGVTIQSITLKYQEHGLELVPDSCLHDMGSFESFLNAVYNTDGWIETMIIKVSIKEGGH